MNAITKQQAKEEAFRQLDILNESAKAGHAIINTIHKSLSKEQIQKDLKRFDRENEELKNSLDFEKIHTIFIPGKGETKII